MDTSTRWQEPMCRAALSARMGHEFDEVMVEVGEKGLWGRNLAVLSRRLPALAQRLATAMLPETHEVLQAENGQPVLKLAGIMLHNRFDPAGEGRSWARKQADRLQQISADTAVVVGMALGYHVEELLKRWNGKVVVCEPDLATIRIALETRDLGRVLERIDLLADERPPAGKQDWGRALVIVHAPSRAAQPSRFKALARNLRATVRLAGPQLKILVVSPMYGGSWEMAGYCSRALADLGHEAKVIDMSPFWPAFRKIEIFGAKRSLRGRLEGLFAEFLAAGVMATVDAWKPNILLAMAQAPLTQPVLRQIGQLGVVRAMWFVEDFRHFDYWRELAPELDYVFTIQQGECLEEFKEVSDACSSYLPCAADPGIHRPLVISTAEAEKYGSDLAFVGAGYRNRRVAFRALVDCGLKIWGNDWEGAQAITPFLQEQGRRVETEAAVKVFNASRVNLNLHSSTYHDGVNPGGDFVNPRTFEIAACGGFQLVDMRKELPPLLSPGEEIVTFSSVKEMRDLCLHYLGRPAEREGFAQRGRRAVLGRHTYRHRMEEMLGEILARDYERLWNRRQRNRVEDVLPIAHGKLRQFLGRFPPQMPFTLDAVVGALQERTGELSDEEGIFLFLHQFDELYLREYRQ